MYARMYKISKVRHYIILTANDTTLQVYQIILKKKQIRILPII